MGDTILKKLMGLIFLSLAGLSTLSGCSTTAPAVSATGPVSAGLRIINESRFVAANLITYGNGDDCNASDKRALVSDTANNNRLMPTKTFDTRIPAGKTFSVRNFVAESSVTCRVVVSFFPEQNKEYILRVNARAGMCLLAIERVESGGYGQPAFVTAEPSARLRNEMSAILHGGATCSE